MYLSFEKVIWVDNSFNVFTTFMVFGLFYTFTGEVLYEKEIIYKILDRIETYEEDNATLKMSDNVGKIMSKEEYSTHIILN